MRRLVDVVVGERRPRTVEGLWDSPVVVGREVVHDPRDDPLCLLPQRGVVEYVGGGQQGLDGVHVCVDATVAVAVQEALVPLLDDHAVLVVPKPAEHHTEGIVEECTSPRAAGGGCAGRGEHDARVLVRRLVGRGRPSSRDCGVPATVGGAADPASECRNAVVG